MNKPTLTREQSSALKEAIAYHGELGVLLWHTAKDDGWSREGSFRSLLEIDLLTMAAALVNGWETEKSPIEELRDEYDRQSKRRLFEPHSDIWCRAVVRALNATGQAIEGINA